MKALIPISPKKKLGIITAVKWTILEIENSKTIYFKHENFKKN
jgi:hypothetical protein